MNKFFSIIFIFLSLCLVLKIYAEEKYISQNFFGIHQHRLLKGNKPWPLVPFGTWRLWDTGICWAEVQPDRGVWNFDLIDKAVKYGEEHNVELVINIGLTPKWAAKYPHSKTGYGNPYITASAPRDIETWKQYVRELAVRYKGKIKYWEIWNEPDLAMFYMGSIRDMVLLVKEAYTILKEVDEENRIISPSVTGYLALIPWLNRFLEAGGGNYIDIIGTHFYLWNTWDKPEKVITTIERIRKYAAKNGIETFRLWDTECGFRKKIIKSEEQSISYLARLSILQSYYGVERVIFYSYDNSSIISMLVKKDDYTGINYNGIAFREIQKWLVGAKITKLKKLKNDIWKACLERESGEKGLMLWHSKSNMNLKIKYKMDSDIEYRSIFYLTGESCTIPSDRIIDVGICPILLADNNFF